MTSPSPRKECRSTSRPSPAQAWRRALMLAALLLLVQSASTNVHSALRFSRQALEHGEWWRLLTAHFVHLSWTHAALNALGAVLCCALAPHVFNAHVWLRTAGLALCVGALLWWCSPDVSSYVGLSGVLYGLFVLGLLPQARRGDTIAGLALAVVAAWMIWQWARGPSAAEEALIGGRIIGIAHVYGFLSGVAGVAVTFLLCRHETSRQK
ncbi:rhombosortase [Parapusillimonas sp. SGNA-6]|nr:rhombosortase [Parapusillimonas sp. SGNA-6]